MDFREEQIVTRSLNDILMAQAKAEDAPMAADRHALQAIASLRSLLPEWIPPSDECREIAEYATTVVSLPER